MAKVSISEAARLAGKDRKTVQRHINSGKLSKEYDDSGNPLIDVSELERFYGKLQLPHLMPQGQKQEMSQLDAPHASGNQTHEIELLKLKLQHAEEMQRRAEEETRREREEKQKLLQVLESTTRLLESSKQEAPPEPNVEQLKPGFWKRLFS